MSETTFAATFRATDQSMAAVFSGVQFAGDGGTNVTIGGKILMTLAVDEYVAAALAQLVNSAPETLDTLAELSKALGDDPNFAATMLELIGGKVDKDAAADNSVYAKRNGSITGIRFTYDGTASSAGTIPLRDANGVIHTGPAVRDDDAVQLVQMNEALGDKLDKVTTTGGNYRLYGIDSNGKTQKIYTVGWAPIHGRIPMFDTGGTLRTGEPSEDNHAVNLAYLNTILDERIGDISAALADAHAYAQSLVNGGGA